VVKLPLTSQKTPVRADSSASRGAADEDVIQGILLFKPAVAIAMGDRIQISGMELRVASLQPRWNVLGRHDHDEVGVEVWETDP
jgi:hypothetical protein